MPTKTVINVSADQQRRAEKAFRDFEQILIGLADEVGLSHGEQGTKENAIASSASLLGFITRHGGQFQTSYSIGIATLAAMCDAEDTEIDFNLEVDEEMKKDNERKKKESKKFLKRMSEKAKEVSSAGSGNNNWLIPTPGRA